MKVLVSRICAEVVKIVEVLVGSKPKLTLLRTRCLVWAGHYLDAIIYAAPRLGQTPDDARLHYSVGQAALNLMKRNYARSRMAYATALDPANVRYRFALAYCAQILNQHETAQREYLNVLRQTPRDLNARLNLALLRKAMGKHEQALTGFTEVLDSRPKEIKALIGAAICHYELGSLDQAKRLAMRCAQVDDTYVRAQVILGRIALAQEESATARVHFEAARKIEPEDGYVLASLGRLYMSDNPPQARHLLREALIVSRPDRSAHFDLGQYYEIVRDLERAIAEYQLFSRFHTGGRANWARKRIIRLREKRLVGTDERE